MNLERYEFRYDGNFTTFKFFSEGKNGRVIKVVKFQQFNPANIFYNLLLGDKDDETGYIDDLAITNNGDTKKVLATVAAIVDTFTEKHPEAWIHATGSTKARTRLYRMLINKYFDIALERFTITGKYQDQWEKYEKNKNYQAFAVQRKISKFEI